MIGQHTNETTDREPVEPARVLDQHGAMLLMHGIDRELAEPPHRMRIAQIPIAGVRQQAIGANILRERQRAGIENQRAGMARVADDG